MRIWVLLVAVTLTSCGKAGPDSGKAAHCVAGQARDCTCPDGASSEQTCGTDRTFEACECGDVPDLDSGAVDQGAQSDAGLDASTSEADAGHEDAGSEFALPWTDCSDRLIVEGPGNLGQGGLTIFTEGQPFTRVAVDSPTPAEVTCEGCGTGSQGGSLIEAPFDVLSMRTLFWRIGDECRGKHIFIRTEPERLMVVLDWENPEDPLPDMQGADIDLHLLHPDGTWNSPPYDVYWQNPTPDWGVPGPDDDPALLLDDGNGQGPEVLTMRLPEPASYRLGAYYYSDNGVGPAIARIRVFWGTLEVASERAFMPTTSRFWQPGTLTFPGPTYATDVVEQEGFPTTP